MSAARSPCRCSRSSSGLRPRRRTDCNCRELSWPLCCSASATSPGILLTQGSAPMLRRRALRLRKLPSMCDMVGPMPLPQLLPALLLPPSTRKLRRCRQRAARQKAATFSTSPAATYAASGAARGAPTRAARPAENSEYAGWPPRNGRVQTLRLENRREGCTIAHSRRQNVRFQLVARPRLACHRAAGAPHGGGQAWKEGVDFVRLVAAACDAHEVHGVPHAQQGLTGEACKTRGEARRQLLQTRASLRQAPLTRRCVRHAACGRAIITDLTCHSTSVDKKQEAGANACADRPDLAFSTHRHPACCCCRFRRRSSPATARSCPDLQKPNQPTAWHPAPPAERPGRAAKHGGPGRPP